MIKPLIVLGDTTDHGGSVISAAPYATTDDKRIARVGDMVSCPQCKGIFPIAEGDPSMTFDGAAAAYDGCKAACGAKLIAGGSRMATEPAGGAGIGIGFGALGLGLAAAYEDKQLDTLGQRFLGRFQVVYVDDGQPASGQAVRVRSTNGQYLTGTTDAQGYTMWVERDAAEALAFDMIPGDHA